MLLLCAALGGATASVTSVRILCLCFKGLPSLPSLGSAAAFRSRHHRWRYAHPRPLPNEASYHVKLGAYCSQVGLLVSLM